MSWSPRILTVSFIHFYLSSPLILAYVFVCERSGHTMIDEKKKYIRTLFVDFLFSFFKVRLEHYLFFIVLLILSKIKKLIEEHEGKLVVVLLGLLQ